MTRTYVQSGHAATTGAQATLAVTLAGTTAGNLIKLGLSCYQAALISLSDGVNNWTLTQATVGNQFTIQTWDCYVTTGGTLNLTVTIGGTKYCSVGWAEYSLSASSAWAIGGVADAFVGSTSPSASPALTAPLVPTACDLAFLVVQANAESISSIGGGFTLRQAVAFASGSNVSIAIADALNTGTASLNPSCTIAGSSTWTEQLSAITGATNPEPLVQIIPYVTKNGLLIFGMANQTGTTYYNVTAVSANPTVTVNGSPITLYGPVWTDLTLQCPYVGYQNTSGTPILSTDTVKYTLPAAAITTTAGATSAVAAAATMTNYVGRLEPGFGGATSFTPSPSTLRVGFDLAYPGFINYFGLRLARNARLCMSPWAGSIIAYDATDVTLLTSWTAGTVIWSWVWHSVASNGIEVNSGQIGMPSPIGQYSIVFEDAHASDAGYLQVELRGDPNTAAGVDDGSFTGYSSTGSPNSTRTVSGTTVTINYPNVHYKSDPNLTYGYNLGLAIYCKSTSGLWAANITNFWVFVPGDAEVDVPAGVLSPTARNDPFAIARWTKARMTSPNGTGPASLRFMEMVGNWNNFQNFSDIPLPNAFSWGLKPAAYVQLLAARVYNTDPTMDNVGGNSTYPYAASTKIYSNLLGISGSDATGTYLDLAAVQDVGGVSPTVTQNNGAYVNPFGGGGVTGYVAIEFETVLPHGLRNSDLFQFPNPITLGQPVNLPCTGATKTSIGNASVTKGSTTITLATSQALGASQCLTFLADLSGQAYRCANTTTVTGTVFTIVPQYNGPTNAATTCYTVAATDINNLFMPVYVTGANTFVVGCDDTFGVTSGTGIQRLVSASNAPISLLGPLAGTVTVTNGSTTITFATAQTIFSAFLQFSSQPTATYTLASSMTSATVGTLTTAYTGTSSSTGTASTVMNGFPLLQGSTCPYGFAVHMCAQWSNCTPWLPLTLGMTDACLQAIADDCSTYATPGMKINFEFQLEHWNTPGFTGGLIDGVFGNMLAFLPALTEVNSLYLSPTSPAALGIDAVYTIMAAHAYDVIQARFDTHGNGVKVGRVFGSQFADDIYTKRMIEVACGTTPYSIGSPSTGGLQAQIGMEYIAVAPYNGSPIQSETGDKTFTAAFTSIAGTVSVTHGSTSITFSTSQTLGTSTLLTFSSDPTGTIYTVSPGGTGTAFTLTVAYGGTTLSTATCCGNWPAPIILDWYRHYLKYGRQQSICYGQHQADIANYSGPTGYSGQIGGKPALIGYEGQIARITGQVPLDHDLEYRPEMVDTFNAFLQSIQDGDPNTPNSGCVLQEIFNFGGQWGNITWPVMLYHGQGVGDGSTNTYTTPQGGSPGDGTCRDHYNVSVEDTPLLAWFQAANGGPAPSFTVSPTSILASDASPVTLTLTGTSTAWTSGSTVSVTNSVSGTTTVTEGTWTQITATSATLTVTTGAGSGTYEITIDSVVSPALTVTTTLFTVSPTSVLQNESSPVTLTLTGTNTTWTSGSAVSVQNSVSGTTTVTAGTWTWTSGTSATLAVTTGLGAGTWTITVDSIVSPGLTVSAASFAVSPTTVLADNSSPVTLTLTGTGTTWTSGSTVSVTNSVSGTTTATAGTWTRTSGTAATLAVTTGLGAGTFKITVDGVVSPAETVSAPSFAISPPSILQNESSPVTLTMTGTDTNWTSGSTVSIQNSVTGTTTVTAGIWTQITATAATLAVTTGSGAGTFTVTIDSVVSPALTVSAPTVSITVRPSRIPPKIYAPLPSILLQLIGTGTAWTSGSAVSVQNSVTGTGVTYVTAGTWTAISTTSATLTVTTGPVSSGPGTGTFTVTVDGVVSAVLVVAPRKPGWFKGLSRGGRFR